MNSDNSRILVSRYPEMFKGAGDLKRSLMSFGFECGDGWFNILDTLLAHAYYPVGELRRQLEQLDDCRLREPNGPPAFYKAASWDEYEARLRAELAKEIEALPVLVQVKEKFGALRVYVHGGSADFQAQIEYAESLSCRTCEECGAPGFRAGPGWIQTLCAEHYAEKHGQVKLEELAQNLAAASILEEYFKGAPFLKKGDENH